MGEISPQLADNEAWVDQTFEKCDDILHRQVYLGQGRQEGLLVYVEVAVSNLMLEEHVIGLSDVQPLKSYEEGKAALQEMGCYFWMGIRTVIRFPAKDIQDLE